MGAQILIVLGLLLVYHSTPTIGGDVKSIDTAEPAIERSDHYGPSHHEEPKFQGFWKKKFVWQPRWVKTWQEKKVYVPVWKKIWSPVIVKEWVPVSKPPPGWAKQDSGSYH